MHHLSARSSSLLLPSFLLALLNGCATNPESVGTSATTTLATPGFSVEESSISGAASRVELGSYHIRGADGVFQGQSGRQGFDATFGAEGVEVQGEGWELGISLRSWGVDWATTPAAPARLSLGDCLDTGEVDAEGSCLRRLDMDRGGLTEWWENRPDGLHQGFTLHSPVEGALVLQLAITGASVEVVDRDLALLTTTSGEQLHYAGLLAWDATGRELPATIVAADGGLELHVDAEGAVWPLTVDPTLSTVESNQASANFGQSVVGIGDVNGDGYGDVAVGSPYFDNGQTNEGRVFVFLGSASGLASTAAWTAEANQASALFGYSVGAAGDVNGDGFDDLVVGAYLYDNGQTDEGRAYLYLGSATGLGTTAAWTAESDQASARFGWSVSGAGDVNGDGFGDVVVGATQYDNGHTDEGRASLYLGSATGLSTTAAWTAESNQGTAYTGWSVDGAGDVNGDGFGDVAIGSTLWDNGQTNEGRASVYLGSAAGLATTASWNFEPNQSGAAVGGSVVGAGDVNGDGYADLAVGAYLYDNGQINEGRALVFHGSATGLATSASWTGEPNQANAYLGYSVAAAGDVNGDGYADLVAGAHLYDNGQTDEGGAWLWYGSATGLSSTAAWTGEADQASAYYGYSVAGADVNGDGYSDVIAGSYAYDNGQTNEGRAFIYLTTPPDSDGDGDPASTDCDDTDATVYTGATETCDGVDEDCDGVIDDNPASGGNTFYADADADGYGSASGALSACSLPSGYATSSTDCNDTDATINPGATEVCDSVDNDCDGSTDETGATGGTTWYLDSDLDGYGGSTTSTACTAPSGYISTGGDCNDSSASFAPGVAEIDDNLDQDCDGFVDEDFVAVGDIVITELSKQPRMGGSVVNTAGQWIELYNDSTRTIDLSNWHIARTSSVGTDRFTINPASALTVAPGAYVVLCASSTYQNSATSPYALVCDYVWKDSTQASNWVGTYQDNTFNLQPTIDNIQVYVNGDTTTGTLVDNVIYYNDATRGYWPAAARFTMTLDPAHLNSTDNDSITYWCATTATGSGQTGVNYNNLYRWYDVTTGTWPQFDEYGTPGSANYDCPAI